MSKISQYILIWKENSHFFLKMCYDEENGGDEMEYKEHNYELIKEYWNRYVAGSEKGYSVRLAKQQIRLLQAEARKECSEATAKDTGMMFLPMEMPSDSVCPENYLFGITLTFPNGTIVTIKKGSAKSVMHLMKLYEKEDLLCLD